METVDLVDHDVRQRNDPGMERCRDEGAVALIHFEHGHVALDPAGQADLLEQGGGQSLADVRRRLVREHCDAVRAQSRDEHLGRRGLSARSGHDDETVGETVQNAREETRSDLVDDKAGNGGSPARLAPAREDPHSSADQDRRCIAHGILFEVVA